MTWNQFPLFAALLAVACISTTRAQDNGIPPLSRMIELKNWFFDQAVHPETHLIYGKIDLEDPDHWKKTIFPAPKSIRNRICDDSETPNVSNCAISNGVFLGQLVDAYEVAKDRDCMRQAKVVFEGLRSLAHASPRKGFVARCLLPGDPAKTHLINSSVDQYTFYVYGLYKYYFSPLASDQEKREIRQIMHEICTSIEEDGTILATNGIPAWVSDIEAIRSDRSSRLLEAYLVGFAITGNQHWHDAYMDKVKERGYARLRTLLDPHRVRHPYLPRDLSYGADYADLGSIWQTQYSLVPLVELEDELPLKAAYLEAMRLNARIAEQSGKGPHALPIIMFAQNRSVIASTVAPSDAPYLEALRTRCKQLLQRDPKSRAGMEVYWTGMARGVLK